ncbi:MAG: aldolase [Rhodothermales bacterium]
MTETELREQMCRLGRTLFDRGYAVGGAGNLSLRLPGDTYLVTPTGSCMGRLDAGSLSKIASDGTLLSGAKPTKEFAFHLDLYGARPGAGAVVHLHSTYLTALSCRRDLDYDNAIRPFTPYFVMRIGELPVVPYYRPGDPRIGRDLAELARTRDAEAFLLASHGPVVLGSNFEEAVDNAEELEETARLWFLLRDEDVRYLTDDEITELRG